MPPDTLKTNRMRHHARQIFDAGLGAVAPQKSIHRHCRRSGDILEIGPHRIDLTQIDRLLVVGGGKATAPMAQAIEGLLLDRIDSGVVVVKYDHTTRLQKISQIEAGHPLPDAKGLAGTRQMMELARKAHFNDLVLCLISGGGSALMTLPDTGISLAHKQQTTDVLLTCGATIHELNTLRKHLSAFKGGRLAQAAAPARVVTLILSDVVGDDLDVIASGPTVADPSTFGDCLEIIRRYNISDRLPKTVLDHFQAGLIGDVSENPKPGDKIFETHVARVIGSNIEALTAAHQKAQQLGYHSLILSSGITGETRHIAGMHAAMAREILTSGHPIPSPACLLSGGETTVTLQGTGKGGRNQEFALAAVDAIADQGHLVLLSAGTDGTDGPTNAAGAIADHATRQRAGVRGLEVEDFLKRNDAYNFFSPLGDLVITGPTRTNVMDLRILLVSP